MFGMSHKWRGSSYALAFAAVGGLLVSLVMYSSVTRPSLTHDAKHLGAKPSLDFGQLPLSFEPNSGQIDRASLFVAHANGATLFFSASKVVLALQGSSLAGKTIDRRPGEQGSIARPDPTGLKEQFGAGAVPSSVELQFIGADMDSSVTGGQSLPARVNYFLGNDPSRWRTDLPTYSSITYSQLYKGIDLNYSGIGIQLKGTYTVAPGADPANIRWRYEGASGLRVDEAGNLQIQIAGKDAQSGPVNITEQAPVAWQELGTQRVSVPMGYSVADDGSVGFTFVSPGGSSSYNPAYPLTIDPTLTYSTFLGGSDMEKAYWGNSMVVDAQGYVYITGQTQSNNFPTRDAFQPQYRGGQDYGDAFVAKLNPNAPPDQQLVYATYLGGGNLGSDMTEVGPGDDVGTGIGLDSAGNIYVSGATNSLNFPLQNSYQPSYGGGEFDAFITKLNPTGSALIYSTYLGGNGWDDGTIAVNSAGEVYIGGETASTNLPMVNAFRSTFAGVYDAFVSKLDSAGANLLYSTYLGGRSWDFGVDLALDSSGKVYLTGYTSSVDYPVHNAFQPTGGGSVGTDLNFDAFISVVDPSAPRQQQLLYSTYLGGSIAGGTSLDLARTISVDATGNIYVGGATGTLDFPVSQGAFQSAFAGGVTDAFLTKLNPNVSPGQQLIFSTYLGGQGVAIAPDTEEVMGLAIDEAGNTYVTGRTDAPDFPLQDPIQAAFIGIYYDAFIAKLNPAGSALLFSTYMGGNGQANGNTMVEQGSNIVLDGSGRMVVLGQTDASNFPTQNGFQPTYGGGRLDAFVALITEGSLGTPTITPTTPTAESTSTATAVPPSSTAVPTSTPCAITFTDVDATSPFYAPIRCLACRGIISGYSDGTFRPGNETTRGQIAKIVSNAAGYSEDPNPQIYEDVDNANPFYTWINRLSRRGYMGGYSCGASPEERCVPPGNRPYFHPFANATRGQISKIVSNAAGIGGAPTGVFYTDVQPDNPFYLWIMRLTNAGVMSGYQCGGVGEPCDSEHRPYFRPYRNVTRGQASKIVAGAFFPNCAP